MDPIKQYKVMKTIPLYNVSKEDWNLRAWDFFIIDSKADSL